MIYCHESSTTPHETPASTEKGKREGLDGGDPTKFRQQTAGGEGEQGVRHDSDE